MKKLEEAIQWELNTTDKRYMFLQLEFKRLVSRINLEGSSHIFCFRMLDEFKKQGLIEDLKAVFNSKFGYKL